MRCSTRRRALAAVAGLVFCAALVGCEVTADDIDRYKDAVNGVNFIGDALSDPDTDPGVRARAIEALVEIGELKELEAALELLQEDGGDDASEATVEAALERFTGMLTGGDEAGQVRAKDALFTIRDYASDDDRATIDTALVEWLAGGVYARLRVGSFSAKTIVDEIGKPAVPILLKVLDPANAEVEDTDRISAANLLVDHLDDAQREAASTNLVTFAKGFSPELPGQVATALSKIGGASALEFLVTFAGDSASKDDGRVQALRALKALITPEVGPTLREPMEKIAGDGGATPLIRKESLDILVELSDSASLPLMTTLAMDETVQGAMAEVVVKLGGDEGARKWLESLPDKKGTEYPKGVIQFWGMDIAKGLETPVAAKIALDMLKSKNWVARLVALHIFEASVTEKVDDLAGELGKDENMKAVDGVTADRTPVTGPGWEPPTTLGAEAKRVAEIVRGKS